MMQSVTDRPRVDQLKELLLILARDMASLVKQYRETMKEIEELDNGETNDEIADILNARDGKPGAVRASRT